HLCYPNYTEACYLTNHPYDAGGVDLKTAYELVDKLREMGSKSAVITSIKVNETPAVVGYDAAHDEHFMLSYEEVPVHFPGTGDIFSAILISHLLNDMPLKLATAKAMSGVYRLIEANKNNEDKKRGIPLEQYLSIL
ncbi:MAG: bifunctional hydroxymethylpyrimidine kinase/phosphomethylpyrimidine kinase, partial [Segatella oulorum]